jgi:hypothetical protein
MFSSRPLSAPSADALRGVAGLKGGSFGRPPSWSPLPCAVSPSSGEGGVPAFAISAQVRSAGWLSRAPHFVCASRRHREPGGGA